jgi:sortase A
MFLFAHSSLNFWQLGPYATVFNLLNKIEVGDNITMVYKGRPYVYRVFSTEVVAGWNTKPFDDNYTVPVITLVTCDPPGSTQNRRVVKAKLI